MDLIIRRARLAEAPEGTLMDVGVGGGRIIAIAPNLSAEGPTYDAAGRLLCGGLIETHIHLDKAHLLDRRPAMTGRAINPVPYTSAIKPDITTEDVYVRADRALQECILRGTTHIRTHVEVDPKIGMRGFNAIEKLAVDYRWAVDLQVCVFPQDGLTNFPGTEELLVEGLRRGATVLGAAPRYDTDGPEQIRRIFKLAREFDVDIDMHLDVGPSADHLDVYQVIALTEQYRLGGRVTVGHMAKLSLLPSDELAKIGRRLSDAGVNVTVLPATDLFLMGRNHDHAVPRGVADANALLGHGVNCSLSTNNVMNPSTPYGDCSLIRLANLHANLLQISQPHDLKDIFRMITTRSARILNLVDYGVTVGHPADFVVIDAGSPDRAIAEVRQPVAAFKRGKQTMSFEPAILLRPT